MCHTPLDAKVLSPRRFSVEKANSLLGATVVSVVKANSAVGASVVGPAL